MPKFDGTGPLGQGPMTGRKMGFCGCPFCWRSGLGRGRRRGLEKYFAGKSSSTSKEDKLNLIRDYKKALEEELNDVKEEEKKLV